MGKDSILVGNIRHRCERNNKPGAPPFRLYCTGEYVVPAPGWTDAGGDPCGDCIVKDIMER